MMGRGYGCTSATSSLLHMNETNIVPRSTITVPPPVNLRMTGILSSRTRLISTSSAGFLITDSRKLIRSPISITY
ncbi:hypothetical protein HanXRQr2_Chr13g0569271 [Helianthus annuus]|uniref:Uncharacterized protein n=1 Tax=Helianthus annuus TaxID=4232 RepID=A0A9K3EDE3_HELAN|nr:hypothetical protein HanXRQr2_Chr13g0569271 [Helianthus annuus]KAJ0847702.1 hypothetical protein HanPSC8_Chr13g0548281 [Helianthus annuus]